MIVSQVRERAISIHALLAESDISCAWSASKLGDFYPRSPCGERLYQPSFSNTMVAYFYPRSPCGERRFELSILHPAVLFLSTLSLRRATVTVLGIQHRVGISIHALLAESDLRLMRPGAKTTDFYPRSPCGERLNPARLNPSAIPFLSTLSLRRATKIDKIFNLAARHFYPRSPCGERRAF